MPSPLFFAPLVLAAATAGDFQQAQMAAQAEGRLFAADTGVLIALGGEDACTGSDDPEDCRATRVSLGHPSPVLLMEGVPGRIVPGQDGAASRSLLLPLFPYDAGEPVHPALHPDEHDGDHADLHLRLPLPPDLHLTYGEITADLLLEPQEIWSPDDPLPIVLPLRLRALRIDTPHQRTEMQLGPGETGQVLRLLLSDLAPDARQLLQLAMETCSRDTTGRRGGWPHAHRADTSTVTAQLLLEVEPQGGVTTSALYDQPWENPALDRCVQLNSRLLEFPADGCGGGCLALVPLGAAPR